MLVCLCWELNLPIFHTFPDVNKNIGLPETAPLVDSHRNFPMITFFLNMSPPVRRFHGAAGSPYPFSCADYILWDISTPRNSPSHKSSWSSYLWWGEYWILHFRDVAIGGLLHGQCKHHLRQIYVIKQCLLYAVGVYEQVRCMMTSFEYKYMYQNALRQAIVFGIFLLWWIARAWHKSTLERLQRNAFW